MKLIDSLGRIDANLYNKTVSAVNSIEWVQDSFSIIVPGAENYYRSYFHNEEYAFIGHENSCNPQGVQYTHTALFQSAVGIAGAGIDGKMTITTYGEDGGTEIRPWNESGNYYYQYSGISEKGSGPPSRNVTVMTQGALFGFPNILATMPKGTEILEAKCEVRIAGCTGSMAFNPNTCENDVVIKDLSEIDLAVALVAVYPNGEIGGLSGASLPSGDPNSATVIDCTMLVRSMYELQQSDCLGFCAIVTAQGFDMGLPAMPEIGLCDGEDPECASVHVISDYSVRVDWTNVSFGKVFIKLKYPDSENVRAISYQWPVLD